MADKAKLGVWHTTSLQTAKQSHQIYSTTTIAGQKRAYDDTTQNGQQQQQPSRPSHQPPLPSHFRPGFTKPTTRTLTTNPNDPPPLTASCITTSSLPPTNPNNTHNPPTEYTQRHTHPSTPTPSHDPLLTLTHPIYALPPKLTTNLANLGIRSIYPWQKQCLLHGPGLLAGETNLVYSAPTGGGKSLVADVLMLKRVLGSKREGGGGMEGGKAVLVLPYVALVQEKVGWLRRVVEGVVKNGDGQDGDAGEDGESNKRGEGGPWAARADRDVVRVVGFFGGSKVRATWADFDIAVCTIEKANSLINAAITDCSISQLRSVVLDECHMIDDGHRGYLLELLATKLLCLEQPVQIVGMSATLKNIDLLRQWLQGHSYETHYRPIPIQEHLVCDNKIYAAHQTTSLSTTAPPPSSQLAPSPQTPPSPLRTIHPSPHRELHDPLRNAVVALANETVRAGYGVLVFSSSRAGCEADALLISRVLPAWAELEEETRERRLDLLGELRSLVATGLDPRLGAGLTTEERELIATAYDQGVLKVCVATCSLAAGINLPARRVILNGARMGRDLVGPAMLRQMRGRAGRKGKDEVGETYLCCKASDLDAVIDLMDADLPAISSCLISEKRQIQRALLEIIAIRLATSRDALNDYVNKTMLAYSADPSAIQEHVETSLTDLQRMGYITVDSGDSQEDNNNRTFQATQLGRAVVASSLDPDDGIFIHNELQKALQAFVMDGEMHVLYCFTPLDVSNATINWKVFWNELQGLDESGFRVVGLLGLSMVTVERMLHGGILRETTPEDRDTARRYHRFYLALQLRDLCNETPIHRVSHKYDVPRGAVQTLAQTCQGFAAGMIKFCETMGWEAMAAVLDHFSDRLKAGAKADLLALARIPFVKSRTARIFWDNGFKTVGAVANAGLDDLLPVLMQAQPNKVRLAAQDEGKYREKLRAKARVICEAANRLWQIEVQSEIDVE
ncbi:hypothetical protein B0J18DRAFT_482223 [Chaetomium sp. MPI-SDFR-AT-0129]|nr:hypothetical protein B0J18DRAFT_482223 [Chaetomium sp. MPI-SDFR-AT-0129]